MNRCLKISRGNWQCFTLIELLLVITTIAVLASLLLPALSTAREMAKRTVCMGQLRQLAIMNGQYSGTWGSYPPELVWSGPSDPWSWYSLWGIEMGWVPSAPGSPTYCLYRPPPRPRIGSPSVFICPSGFITTNRSDYYYSETYFYQAQSYYAANVNEWIKMSSMKRPSSKIYLYETIGLTYKVISGTGSIPECTDNPPENLKKDFIYGRHKRTVNTLFFDGHVGNYSSRTLFVEKGSGTGNMFDYKN